MIESRKLHERTLALLNRAAADFQRAVQEIASMAARDGEVPEGSRLDATQSPAVWLVEVPDAPKE